MESKNEESRSETGIAEIKIQNQIRYKKAEAKSKNV